MKQGELELRSGVWQWELGESTTAEGMEGRSLRLASLDGGDEMLVDVPDRLLSESEVRALAARARLRRFEDADGTVWTAELKSAGLPGTFDRVPAMMVLFWCRERACLTTLRADRGLGELTVEELRTNLHLCLHP